MKFLFSVLILVIFSSQVQCQAQDKYKRIGGAFVDSTSPNFPYLRWNGSTLVDIRKMTEKESATLYQYERMMSIQSDGRFPNAYWSFNGSEYGIGIQIGY
ncbi:MAG: hypothetical protein DI598_14920, partial [Pseudopedobacter saltans]